MGGVIESHENDLQDLKEAKIRLIKKFNSTLSDNEILSGWTDETSSGISIGSSNNTNDIIDWVNLVQTNFNIDIPFEEFKSAYENELRTVRYYKYVVKIYFLMEICNFYFFFYVGKFFNKV